MLDLYPSVLGKKAWSTLAEPVQRGHRVGLRARGRFDVTHGTSFFAKVVAWASRFPPAGTNVRLELVIQGFDDEQKWTRHFAGHRMETTQYALPQRGRIAERQGPLEVRLRVRPKNGALVYRSEGAALRLGPLRIPLPQMFSPSVKARTWATDSKWMHVRVVIALPFVGIVLKYAGRISSIVAE